MPLSIKYLSQSCFLFQTESAIIYVDPGAVENIDKLPKADLILVSHHHYDHVKESSMTGLSKEGTFSVGPEKAEGKLGKNHRVVRPGENLAYAGIEIRAVDAYNPKGTRLITYHKKGDGVGYLLGIGGKRVYHAGDTGLIEEMNDLGPIDIAFLPIGGRFTMDVDEAVEAVKMMKPGIAVPMHMLSSDPTAFKNKVEGSSSTKVVVLGPGETFSP